MMSVGVRTATIVTQYESGLVDTSASTIDIAPAWRWMLDGGPRA
jgi:hypothetical protein